MGMDVNYIYCNDHFTIYTNTESLYSTPEINIILFAVFSQTADVLKADMND